MIPDGASVRVLGGLGEIAPAEWDACADPGPEAGNPFVAHGFLKALEDSRSVGLRAGWRPMHLVLEQAGRAVAAMPLYLKSHSYGEYVFDQAWARAFEQAGGRYYPKLQCAVPFTSVTGPRLLVRAGEDRRAAERLLIAGALKLAEETRASSLHVTFPDEGEWRRLGEAGFLQRLDQQFHWLNRGYGSFDDFLGALASDKRKNLRKERRRALEPGIAIDWLTGSDLKEAHWDAFFDFYTDTGSRKWGAPYLTREFFSRVSAAMADRILLVMARRSGRYVAGALNFIGGDALYGRNWGAIEHHPFLHFECCYYQAVDYAIAHGLKRVEAGAQGEHKLARGYEPVRTYSAHWMAHPGLRRAVADYLAREREAVAGAIAEYGAYTPFRRSQD